MRSAAQGIDEVLIAHALIAEGGSQNGRVSTPASWATAMPTTRSVEGSGSRPIACAAALTATARSASFRLSAPSAREKERIVTPSGRTSTSGSCPTAAAAWAMAMTNSAPCPKDLVR